MLSEQKAVIYEKKWKLCVKVKNIKYIYLDRYWQNDIDFIHDMHLEIMQNNAPHKIVP